MIVLEKVSKAFQRNGEQVGILDDVSFEVERGEIVTLLGKSGCGKSTLLSIVGGFAKSDTGVVRVDGDVVKRPSKRCVMLFQQRNLLPWRTVFKNVELALEGEQISKEDRRSRVLEALQLVGLEGHEHQFPHELSGGMQQRVAIARAFALQPDVILMDEPFAALDTFNRYHLQDALIQIQSQKGTTILLVTHDIDEAVYLSDRVLIMTSNPGRIYKPLTIRQGKPRDRTHSDFHYYRKKILEEFQLSGAPVVPEYSI